MRIILFGLLSLPVVSGFAQGNNLFQEFDNQISIGYGMQQNTSGYGTTNTIPTNSWVYSTSNILTLDVSQLYNNGIWVNVTANMAFGAGPVNQNPTTGSNGGTVPLNSGTYQSSDYGVNAKFGYAFSVAKQHLQVIPYAAIGLNNVNSLVQYLPATPANAANGFAYLGGVGVRLEYRINRTIMLFGDQLLAYNWDQSGPQNGIQPQNTIQLTTALGAKFNLAQNFQLGVQGVYTNFQPQAGNFTPNGFMMQQQSSAGGLVSLGLTY